MKNYNLTLLKWMGMNNELKQRMLKAEGSKGVGVYLTLDHLLRHIKDYKIRISMIPSIAQSLNISAKYVLKIINSYGLFVVDGEEFYSPEITDLMLRVRLKVFKRKEKELQRKNKKNIGLSELQELKKIKKEISITTKELYDCRIASANMCAMINTISQFKLREREKEKRENASGGIQENSLAARNFSQHSTNEGSTEDFSQAGDLNQDKVDCQAEVSNQAEQSNLTDKLDLPAQSSQQDNPLAAEDNSDPSGKTNIAVDDHPSGNNDCSGTNVNHSEEQANDLAKKIAPSIVQAVHSADQANHSSVKIRRSSARADYSGGEVNVIQAAKAIQANGPLPIKNALQHCGEVKIWSDWADEMVNEQAYMERMAIYSRIGKWFMPHRKQIVELFKQHVEVYSTSDGLITQNDVKYYFANFLRPETPTWKWVIEKLQEEEEARKAADPYRFEKRVNGVRMYPSGGEIPDEATPRPSMYAVWSEVSQSWVGK